MMDSRESCDWAQKHYDLGQQFPRANATRDNLARGFFCSISPLIAVLARRGVRRSYDDRVESMNNLGDLLNWARQSRQISYKYAWYADPEDFEIKMIHKRLFDPEMGEVSRQLRLSVIATATFEDDNCQEGSTRSPRRVLKEESSVVNDR